MAEKILITQLVPDFFVWELKKMKFEVDEIPGISQSDCKNIIHEYTGLYIRSGLVVNRELLDCAIKLQFILRPGSGLDIIDTKSAAEKKIALFNSPEGNRDAVAEHALGLLIGMLKNIPQSFDAIKSGVFERELYKGVEIKDKTVGIVGFGNTGAEFAKRLSSFGCRIISYDKYKSNYAPKYVEEVGMQVIFNESDIVSFHVPLTTETQYMVNEEYLGRFKKPFYLLNTSRGKIIETSALIIHINKGKVKGAGLDVLENENFNSLTEKQQIEITTLTQFNQVVLTSHIAGKTIESENNIHAILINKLKNYKAK